jgi:GNAT superfamily N-acetyltransferase/DNA-binding MarR family transcriptional regulator
MQFLSALGRIALGSRFAALAEQLFQEVQAVYRANGIDFDARNFALFRGLQRQDDCSVGGLAKAIGCTHARASQRLTALERAKLVERIEDGDARRSCFRLSVRGRQLVGRLEPIWGAVDAVLQEEFGVDAVVRELQKLEEKMSSRSLSSQVLARLGDRGAGATTRAAKNFSFKVLEPPLPRDAIVFFRRLNQSWLREFGFSIEEPDRQLFADVDGYLSKRNGRLLLAEADGCLVGTALLLQLTPDNFEVGKLCVERSYRKCGIGRRLLALCETEARLQGGKHLSLETSSRLAAAKKLYEAHGFVSQPVEGAHYRRVDLAMTKALK